MKIVFFTTSMEEGGAQRVISVLSDYFCKNGHEVRIIVTNDSNKICYNVNKSIKFLKLSDCAKRTRAARLCDKFLYKIGHWFSKDKHAFQEKSYYLSKAKLVMNYFKKQPVDVIYSFLVEPNIIIGLAAKGIKSKIVMAERNFPDKPNYTESFKTLRNYCYAKANKCVFQTEGQKEFFPMPVQEKSVVIYNPIKVGLPEAYNGERKKIIVNYCGYRTQKNIPMLIKAFSKIANKYNEYRLEIYGLGGLKDELQTLIDNLNLTDKITLLPFDSDIHNKIVDYSMFVMTSDYEGMPNSLIEAMAIGLPVISTDCDGGGAKAVIENGVNGILVSKGDVNAVAAAMEELIEHPKKAELLSKNAVKIKEKLAVEKIAAEWLKLAE